MSKNSKTDWNRIDAMTDADIDQADSPELGDEFFARAELRLPGEYPAVRLPIDPTILAWFQAQGDGWIERLNQALRQHMQAGQATVSSKSPAI